jgi:hypothetical protein
MRLIRIDQKVRNQAKEVMDSDADGQRVPGSQMAPKAFTIMHLAELGKPDMPLVQTRYLTVRE